MSGRGDRGGGGRTDGSPFTPHTAAEKTAMLEAVGAESVEALFDIPEAVQYEGDFDIEARSERGIRRELDRTLRQNDDLVEFLGRGHYDHYVPSVVDHLSDRSEFITSYTQYQPEVAQGFLQALFEYQSLLVELTGLEVANCSMYDAATALGEAALLSSRVRRTEGYRVLVPDTLRAERASVLENYVAGTDLVVDTYPTTQGGVDVEALGDRVDDATAIIYAESPTTQGVIAEELAAVGSLAAEHGALFCLGSDPVALSLLERPADLGADIVIGDAVLGLPAAYGMGLGLFATREEFLRQVPGRLVGAGEDADGGRAYTLTLQTREQHIRRERATSNICTNQAWVALRAAIHAAVLGPDGLTALAEDCVRYPREVAPRLDEISGLTAPVHDRHHFREFQVRTDQPAASVQSELLERGYAVHAVDEHRLQVCVTETVADEIDGLVRAFREVA